MATHNQESGFSLIEAMIASMLLVVAMTGVYSAFVSAGQWVQPRESHFMNMARDVAESLYPAVRATEWNDPNTPLGLANNTPRVGIPSTMANFNHGTTVSAVGSDLRYNRSYSVLPVLNGARSYRKVVVFLDEQ